MFRKKAIFKKVYDKHADEYYINYNGNIGEGLNIIEGTWQIHKPNGIQKKGLNGTFEITRGDIASEKFADDLEKVIKTLEEVDPAPEEIKEEPKKVEPIPEEIKEVL